MKLSSWFDGISGFPLAASRHGIEPVSASEIEAYPIAVSRQHFPNMKHLGSITDINGAEIEPVDIVTFGSPCQDLSIAGKQRGLGEDTTKAARFRIEAAPADWKTQERPLTVERWSEVKAGISSRKATRSGLFFHAVRIIEEMREATKDGPEGPKPAIAVWENVPGAFSSNAGRDFAAVLQKLVGGTVDVPRRGWTRAGVVFGPRGQAAWRTLDAQFWGVPQRRRRIFLVADFGGERAGQILFESQSLSRDTAAGQEPGQGIADNPADGFGSGGEPVPFGLIGHAAYAQGRIGTLRSEGGDCGGGSETLVAELKSADVCGPICARDGKSGVGNQYAEDGKLVVQPIAFGAQNSASQGDSVSENVTPTLDRSKIPAVAFSCKDDGRDAGEVAPTLRAMNHDKSHANGGGQVAVVQSRDYVVEPIAIQHSVIGRDDDAGPAGPGYREDGKMFTLDSRSAAHAVATAFAVKTNQTGSNGGNVAQDMSFTLDTATVQAVATVDARNLCENIELSAPLQSRTTGGYSLNYQNPVRIGYIVRRLTPTECERLQGYPDGWTACGVDGNGVPVNGSDTTRYKALGNSVAIPCVDFIMRRIAQVIGRSEAAKQQAS